MALPDIRSATTENACYLIETGVKRWIDDFARLVNELEPAEVRQIPTGDPLCSIEQIRESSGMLISDGGQTFWLIENSAKRRIDPPGEEGVRTAGIDLAHRIDLSDNYLNQIVDGPALASRQDIPPKPSLPYRDQLQGHISSGWFVDSTGYLLEGAQAYGDVYLRSTSVWGFHAGIVTLFLDQDGKVLDMREFTPGVSGLSKIFIPGQRPDSDALWNLDPSVAQRTYSIKQVHCYKPETMLANNLQEALRVGETIQDFIDGAKNIPWVQQVGAAVLG